ncbi:MAG: DUF3857 domain-containing protein, partial [Victivallales bacterium]|nr:DUF3857 domain-containing protein [Victivallales bacterium]
MSMRSLLPLLVLSLCAPLLLKASDSSLLKLPDIIAESQRIVAQDYPDADSILLDDHIKVIYQADGKSVTWDDTAVKVLTEKGRRDCRVLSDGYNRAYGKFSYELVQVITADGTVRSLDLAKEVKSMVSPGQMSSNIYDPNQQLVQV